MVFKYDKDIKEAHNGSKKARKAAKAERQKKYMWVFMNGKQVRVKRAPSIDGLDVDEFIRRNADPIWLQQNEMCEDIEFSDNNNEMPF